MENDVDLHTANVLSICAGVGGIDLGLDILSRGRARTVCYVEREAYAVGLLVKRMEEERLASAPIWSDVTSFDGSPWRGVVDILSGGIPCFAPGTLVLTERGYWPIEHVVVGDRVLTHRGRWRRVSAVMAKGGADLWRVDAQGVPGVVCTQEHPFYTRQRRGRSGGSRVFGEPEWVDAGSLDSTRFLGQVVPETVREDSRGEDFWWLVGRYLADGYRRRRAKRKLSGERVAGGQVIIACGPHKADECRRRIAAAGFGGSEHRERTTTRFVLSACGDFYDFLEQFGYLAHGKRIPGWVHETSRETTRALLEGYLAGDGNRCRNGRSASLQWVANSTSKALALGVALLAQRAFGVVASVRKIERPRTAVIEGRTVKQRDYWRVTLPDSNRTSFVDGDYGWKPLNRVTPGGRGTVYNLAVEEDESYCADGSIVHNCQPYSVAGKQRKQSDERDLVDDAVRIVSECRPAVVLLEEVRGFVCWEGLGRFGEQVRALGYRLEEPVIVAASDVGAPHRRQRVFVAAWDVSDTNRERVRLISEWGSPQHAPKWTGSESLHLGAELDDGHGGGFEIDGSRGLRQEGCISRRPDADGPDPGETLADPLRIRPQRNGKRGAAPGSAVRGCIPVEAASDTEEAVLPGTPLWPPGPDDASGWQDYIAQGGPEPALLRGADGVADRVDRIRAIGNGVVPLAVAHAFGVLLSRLSPVVR